MRIASSPIASQGAPWPTSTSLDGNAQVWWVGSPSDPGACCWTDRVSERVERIAGGAWLEPARMATVESFDVTSKDGRAVEAFLAIPHDPDRLPPWSSIRTAGRSA